MEKKLIQIIHRFYNITVIFSIYHYKNNKTIISFSLNEKTNDGEQYSYKVKENIDYAKKIINNTIKHFENISIDCSDIDLCLKKTFSLRKTNTRKMYSLIF